MIETGMGRVLARIELDHHIGFFFQPGANIFGLKGIDFPEKVIQDVNPG
jgi:hypothetical protein